MNALRQGRGHLVITDKLIQMKQSHWLRFFKKLNNTPLCFIKSCPISEAGVTGVTPGILKHSRASKTISFLKIFQVHPGDMLCHNDLMDFLDFAPIAMELS